MIKNIVRYIFGLVAIVACISIASVTFNKPQVTATIDCRKAVVLYARGSGQAENADEKQKLQLELNRSLGVDNYYFIELGNNIAELQGRYPAVSLSSYIPGLNILDAELPFFSYTKNFSWLSLGNYNDSVKSGIDLVLEVIEEHPLITNCPDARIVLSGYSQGAQVIGGALSENRMKPYINKIAYVALFGDPKLNHGSSTSGRTGGYEIPAPWLRGNIAPKIKGGILDGRVPYIPDDIEGFRVGSWCYSQDPICSGNLKFIISRDSRDLHGYYGTLYIPEAADEIATVLYRDTGVLGAATPTCGAAHQDIVVAIDLNDVMRRDLTLFSEAGATYLSDNIFSTSCNTRIAIVGYNENGTDPPRLIQDFTTSRQDIINAIVPLYENTTEQTPPQSPVREAAIYAMDLSWRENAQKAVLLVFNSIGSGWDMTGKYSWQARDAIKAQSLTKNVIQKTRDKGGVQIFTAVLSPYMQGGTGDSNLQYASIYSEILTQPSAGSQLSTGGRPASSWQNVNLYGLDQSFTDQPKVRVGSVRTKVGQTVSINAVDESGSVIKKAIDSKHAPDYSWYLDCDNPLQQTSVPNSPTITFKPLKTGKCTVAVKTAIAYSYCNYCIDPSVQYLKSLNTFEIDILSADYQEPPVPPEVTNIQRVLQDGKLTVSWDTEDSNSSMFIIRDQDGEAIGITQEKQVIITGLPKGELPNISISNVVEDVSSEPIYVNDSPLTIITSPQPIVAAVVTEPQSTVPEFSYINQTQDEAVMGAVDRQISSMIDLNTNLSQAATMLKEKIQTATGAVWLWLLCIGITIAVSILIFFYERRKREV